MSSLSRLSKRIISVLPILLMVGLLGACSEDEDTTPVTGGNLDNATGSGLCTTYMAAYVDNNLDNTDITAWDGGQLYDKWWAADDVVPRSVREPFRDHSMWSQVSPGNNNTTRNSGTWRCKECHGWDYKGNSGEYGDQNSSHYTNAPGLYSSRNTPVETFCAIREGEGINSRHVFNADETDGAFSDANILKLVKFLHDTGSNAITNADNYIDTNGLGRGIESQGRIVYETDAGCAASRCHGTDGTFASDSTISLGQLALDNPWEVLHKIRYGHPGSIMPAFIDDNLSSGELTETQIKDVLTYAQSLRSDTGGNQTGSTGICTTDMASYVNDNLNTRDINAWDGGQLYDKWWNAENVVLAGTNAPVSDHLMWAQVNPGVNNTTRGAGTWRCKECHGWDYKGVSGEYGDSQSSHYTGAPSLFSSRKTPVETFCSIREGQSINSRHVFDARGTDGAFSDVNILRLVKFLQVGRSQY